MAGGGIGDGPSDYAPVVVGGGQGCAAEGANQGVTGTGGQTQPPGEQVPDDGADQGGKNGVDSDIMRVDQTLADCCGHRHAC